MLEIHPKALENISKLHVGQAKRLLGAYRFFNQLEIAQLIDKAGCRPTEPWSPYKHADPPFLVFDK